MVNEEWWRQNMVEWAERFLSDLQRIADSLETISRAMENQDYPVEETNGESTVPKMPESMPEKFEDEARGQPKISAKLGGQEVQISPRALPEDIVEAVDIALRMGEPYQVYADDPTDPVWRLVTSGVVHSELLRRKHGDRTR